MLKELCEHISKSMGTDVCENLINLKNNNGEKPIHLAAQYSSVAAVLECIKRGIFFCFVSPIFYACSIFMYIYDIVIFLHKFCTYMLYCVLLKELI